jgi:hypothetical protein
VFVLFGCTGVQINTANLAGVFPLTSLKTMMRKRSRRRDLAVAQNQPEETTSAK